MFELTRRNSLPITTYNPFREMEDIERSFFHDPFSGFFGGRDFSAFRTDVTDEGTHYLLEADLPGFDKKNIKLDVNGDVLTVRAERHAKSEEKDSKDKVVRMERSYGSYCRSFDVSGVNIDGIKAKYENGVLTMRLPKKEDHKPEPRILGIE